MAGPRRRIVTAALETRSLRALALGALALAASLAFLPAAEADHDTSAPVVSYTLSGTAGTNGWFRSNVTIHWSVVEPEGLTSSTCLIAQLVTAEGTATYSCTATSHGGTATGQVTLRIDKTLPSVPAGTAARAPDANGWYNRPVAVSFTGTDAVSGIASCSGSTYSGPDSATASATGSCTDRAGNTSSGALSLQYDDSAPGVTAAASRSPDANGWYRAPLTVSFAQAPGDVSGLGSCSPPVGYSGPDAASVVRSGTCTDRAGNTSSPVAFELRYDSTAPAATAAASRAPDADGWYNRGVTISFAQVPGDLSGAGSCSAAATYTGPDAAAVSRSGTCTDRAGNTSAAVAFGFKYDATAPSASGALARAPDRSGWYNRPVGLDVSGADAMSGIASCASPAYAGPDGASRTVSGTCTDRAGNVSSPASATIAYDATPPTAAATLARAPDANGWYHRPVAVSVTGADATSGLAGCTGATYSGPDGAGRQVPGGCTDVAGNTGPATATLNYDATPPTTNAAPDRGDGGWYREPVTVSFGGTDGASGLATCTPPATYSGPDTTGATLAGSCADVAGNASTAAFTVKFDATAPSVSGGLARAPDANGWFNRPVGVVASGGDATSGLSSCSTPSYGGPDTASVTLGVSCRDNAGNSAAGSVSLKYDATPPTVTTAADRPPDGAGWYRRALTVGFAGADATSGIESCTAPVRYGGPDRADSTVTGSCRDHAGNAAPATHAFRYDATAPRLARVALRIAGGVARLSWRRPADAVSIHVTRTPGRNRARATTVYRGKGAGFADRTVRKGVRYRYEVAATDVAGNVARTTVTGVGRPALYRPAAGAVVRAPLTLGWEAVAGARFYNVQLLRSGRKILSAWPEQPTLRLSSGWTFGGKRQRLEPGVYTWWVWAARGTRAQPQYGRPLGSSTFTVRGR